MAIEYECDECGSNKVVDYCVCEKCLQEYKSQIEELEKELDELKGASQ